MAQGPVQVLYAPAFRLVRVLPALRIASQGHVRGRYEHHNGKRAGGDGSQVVLEVRASVALSSTTPPKPALKKELASQAPLAVAQP